MKKEISENPKPVILECMTFRMRGHEEASGTKYVPKDLMEKLGQKDPVNNYEIYLKKEKIISDPEISIIKKRD